MVAEALYTPFPNPRVDAHPCKAASLLSAYGRAEGGLVKPRGRISLYAGESLHGLTFPLSSFSTTALSFRTSHYSHKMITPIVRRQLIQTARHSRCFSSSPIAAAQEVKRLGVIGAGQMVILNISSFTLPRLTNLRDWGSHWWPHRKLESR
jgi:hypothetical protein